MERRHSEVLLSAIRRAMKQRGWNTAAMARALGMERREARAVLAGRQPLNVDDFAGMVEALRLAPEELGVGLGALDIREPSSAPGSDDDEPRAEPPPKGPVPSFPGSGASSDTPLRTVPPVAADPSQEHGSPCPPTNDTAASDVHLPDSEGNQAEQLFKFGFALGVDMHFLAQASMLKESGLPETVLERFPDLLPIKLDAAFHRFNKPRYFPEGLQLSLSFDTIRTCLFPWEAIRQVSFFPEPPIVETTEPADSDSPRKPGRGKAPPALRLVKA